jgi:hypothetical protein
MEPQPTWDFHGGVIFVYSHQVMIMELIDRKIHFHCNTGITSCMWWSLREAKQWLTDEKIKFRHIAESKLACLPHVCGFRRDNSLIYNRVHYDPLPEDFKRNLNAQSITDNYKKKWKKTNDEEAAASAIARSSANTIYCNACTGMHFIAFDNRDTG